MALVNIDELTQEQRWGLLFEMQQANEAIAAKNAAAEEFNANPLPGRELLPIAEQYTLQSFADSVCSQRLDDAYVKLVQFKQGLAIKTFNASSLNVQAAALSVLGVPDVVTE